MGIIKSFKDHVDSETLPYLQTNRLACHSFIGASRRHKIPGSEAKDSYLMATAVARGSAISVLAPQKPHFPHGDAKKVVLQKKNPEFKEHESFIMVNKHVSPSL